MADGMKRRDFLKVLGATGAGAATVGCSTREVERLIPYVIPPEEIVPGVPTWYTSTCRECPAGCGIHVETHEGRATKVEGNPDHPISRGNLCARGQASVQGLYHPDRYQGPVIARGRGPHHTTSPGARPSGCSRSASASCSRRGRGRTHRLPHAGLHRHDGAPGQRLRGARSARAASSTTSGRDQPRGLDFADADVLVSFGADFLETWGSPVEYAWQFAQMHSCRDGPAREVRLGRPAPAAHRPERRPVGRAAARARSTSSPSRSPARWTRPRPRAQTEVAAGGHRSSSRASSAPGNGVALGPGAAISGPQRRRSCRQAIAALNGGARRAGGAHAAPGARCCSSSEQMRRGRGRAAPRSTRRTRPTPCRARSASPRRWRRCPTRVSFSTFPDETAELCTTGPPRPPLPGGLGRLRAASRASTSWSSRRCGRCSTPSRRATCSSPWRASQLGARRRRRRHHLLRLPARRLGGRSAAARRVARRRVKRGGVFPGAATRRGRRGGRARGPAPRVAGGRPPCAAAPARRAPTRPRRWSSRAPTTPNFNLVVYPSYRFFDGRTANRPWLLELPDPVTKVSWQLVGGDAPARGRASWGSSRATSWRSPRPTAAPACRSTSTPGCAPTRWPSRRAWATRPSAATPRAAAPTRTASSGRALDQARSGLAPLRPAGEGRRRSRTADERPLHPGRGPLRGGRPDPARPRAGAGDLRRRSWRSWRQSASRSSRARRRRSSSLRGYGGFAPVATTDRPGGVPAARAPTTAQYVEGADPLGDGRRPRPLHRLRRLRDRLPGGEQHPGGGPQGGEARPRASPGCASSATSAPGQDEEAAYARRRPPTTCASCPCSASSAATRPASRSARSTRRTTRPDGLNGQVYNRCVGTRYCANNCPYKVRYFNWWTYDFARAAQLAAQPGRGGAREGRDGEVHLLRAAHPRRRSATRRGRTARSRDGEVVPACVQTCPTEVFVFGNIQDPDSKVAQAARSVRGYRALEELNTQPAVVYLKKVTLREPGARASTRRGRARPWPPAPRPTETTGNHDGALNCRSVFHPEVADYEDVNRDAMRLLTKPGKGYLALLGVSVALVGAGGPRVPRATSSTAWASPGSPTRSGWGTFITTFVFWVGIGHAGTLISAILYLFRAPWRQAIYRLAEAMTVFAVHHRRRSSRSSTSGGPGSSTGCCRCPASATSGRTSARPLLWDVFAVTTYLTVSSRSSSSSGSSPTSPRRATPPRCPGGRRPTPILALGWRGTDREWKNFTRAYLFLAALATPLVLSVHSVVSWDFAVSIVPGWHTTIFAPYFVAGAILSGVAMVVTIAVPVRKIFHLEAYLTDAALRPDGRSSSSSPRSSSATPTAWSTSWPGTPASSTSAASSGTA